MKDIRSARLLLKAVKNLEASLQKPYQPFPEDPAQDFFTSVANVILFSGVVYKDLVAQKGENVLASGALSAAIALDEYDYALRFLKEDIALVAQEGGDIETLRELVELGLKNHNRSDRWNQLLLEFRDQKKG